MPRPDKNDPEDVVKCLNEYFSEMIEIILAHGGTVDKFMGDSVLVVFGAPMNLPDVEYRAASCALEMQTCLNKLNERRESQGLF
ncbi:MAG TPA: adenylate/guanylate cyclase domain-containing protein, partial [Methyloversatilis sp.]